MTLSRAHASNSAADATKLLLLKIPGNTSSRAECGVTPDNHNPNVT